MYEEKKRCIHFIVFKRNQNVEHVKEERHHY